MDVRARLRAGGVKFCSATHRKPLPQHLLNAISLNRDGSVCSNLAKRGRREIQCPCPMPKKSEPPREYKVGDKVRVNIHKRPCKSIHLRLKRKGVRIHPCARLLCLCANYEPLKNEHTPTNVSFRKKRVGDRSAERVHVDEKIRSHPTNH